MKHRLSLIILSDTIITVKEKYISLVLLFIWMGLIFLLSNQSASDSSELSNHLLDSILMLFRIDVDPSTKEILAKIIRKLAHFTEYFILGILAINVSKGFKIKNAYIIAFVFCFLYATSDEIHQLFVLNRYGSVYDILLDSLGSFLALSFIHLIEKKCFQEKKH